MLLAVRIVIAPDSFKGTLTADAAAEAIAVGARRALPGAECLLRPVADGGEGTVAAAVRAGWAARRVRVSGPDGALVTATFALRGRTAVVELATAAGIGLLARPAPLTASTRGVGELLLAALDAGVDRIVLGIGGSATTDGGAGMLQALGARLVDAIGADVPPGGGGLERLERIEVGALDPRLAGVEVVVASDVDNPLTGPEGAAATFAPQKGATPEEVAVLDAALTRLAAVLARDAGLDVTVLRGGGGAGGTAAGAVGVLGARIVSGAALVCDLVGLDEVLRTADLAVTGEGSLDAQTLRGKAPHEVVARASAAGVPCVALAGRVRLDPAQLRSVGFAAAHAMTEVEPDLERCVREPAAVLADLAAHALAARR
jgi:glycerate kinase